MQYVSDLHIHSKYSRAVSKNMTLPVMAEVAAQKGLSLISVGDFTHPLWFADIKEQLEEAGEGVYHLKSEYQISKSETGEPQNETLFLLSTEISSIYKQGDKLRRIHNLIFAPNISVVEKITAELKKRGCNLNADGRPIIGLWSKHLLELILSIDERCMLIPCHIWTPHFGMYGSASGFNSLEESFGELTPHIYGIETGLSSDPDMNWQVKELLHRTILSFSDAHSPAKMGREATVFELESPTYEHVRRAIMKPHGGLNRIDYTIEFYPEEGKYHYSGHRNCKVSFGPDEIRNDGNTCPVCHKSLTEGVLYRVQQLSDSSLFNRAVVGKNAEGLQWFTDKMKIQPPYMKLVPLLEIIAEGMGVGTASKKVQAMYQTLCASFPSEFFILLHANISDVEAIAGYAIAESLQRVRKGNIVINPGFDGEFGKVRIWTEEERKTLKKTPQLQIDFHATIKKERG